MAPTDDELIRDYTGARSSAAFATLVERHLNLVYSVARRHVRSGALAEEVAQAVFVDLARDAARLKPNTPLVAWLHLVARRTAIDVVRREIRRQAREVEAAQLAETMKTPEPAWSEVEPLLDEAVESLAPADRTAILLRYFENKSLREVGAALGTSDDAAQKRVSRAVEELRAFFARRGVAVTAASLATTITTHATVVAPVGLGATIASTTTLASAASAEVARTVAMTTLQKSLVAASLVFVAGAGLHEANALVRQRSEVTALQTRADELDAQLHGLRDRQQSTAAQLKAVEGQIDLRLPPAATPGDPALESQARTWLAGVERLQQLSGTRPEFRLPEKTLLTNENWFDAVTAGKTDSEEGIRQAFATLRNVAASTLANQLSSALGLYIHAHEGMLPESLDQLAPFFDPPLDPALTARFALRAQGKVADLPEVEKRRLIELKSPVDVEYDSYWQIGNSGMFMISRALDQDITEAQREFAKANEGRKATSATELAPFLRWPVDPVAVQKRLSRGH